MLFFSSIQTIMQTTNYNNGVFSWWHVILHTILMQKNIIIWAHSTIHSVQWRWQYQLLCTKGAPPKILLRTYSDIICRIQKK